MQKINLFSTKTLVFSAACIALSTVIANFIKLPSLPFGGSATLFSMFFVAFPGYLFGPIVGIVAGIAHGIIQFISNPYAIHPLQVILDYPLAFGALGLSGFFSEKKNGLIKGYAFGVFGRFVFSTISGLIFFTEYVTNLSGNALAVWGSITYNLSYLLPEAVLSIVLLLIKPVKNGLSYIKRMAQKQ